MVNKMTTILLLLCLLASCKKDTPVEAAPALPAATQSGKNTMGCKINGELFLLNGKEDSWSIGLSAAQYNLNDTVIRYSISFNSRKPNIYVEMSSIGSAAKNNDTLSLNGIHPFEKRFVILDDFRENTITGASYRSDQIHGGTLIITKNTPYFMSGTFEFEIFNREDSTKSVKVTEGRFDIEK